MSSFIGKFLLVDLSSGSFEEKELPRKWAELYTGQKGLGTRFLMEYSNPDVDPLSPGNPIILSPGVMTGTIVSSSAKLAVTSRSPQTGTVSDGSVGGHIGAEIKYAGYDAVVITGACRELSCIYIDPDRREIIPVPELIGTGSFATEDAIKARLGDEKAKVMCIGPAGENLVPFSCISSERYRQLGRGGMGAVMGSKKLKAIAFRGWLDVSAADMEACRALAKKVHIDDGVIDPENEIYDLGTPCLVDYSQESGLLPTRNFSEGTFEKSEAINGQAFKNVRQNKKACFSCGIACGNFVAKGSHNVEGPEYETIAIGGSSLGIGNVEDIIHFNSDCDDLGLDTISTGGTIAWMMEMTGKGIHDFGIRFGEAGKVFPLLKDIALRRGIGTEASLGSLSMAKKYGHEDISIQVKGMELPGYDPRGSWGMGIAYASAPRGGCHMSCYPIAEEAWGQLDPFTFEGKAKLVADMQNSQFAKFSMGVCDFWPIGDDTLGKLYEVTFGGTWSAADVYRIGERIFNLQRMYNVMAGFDRREDKLPGRFHKELLKAGPPKDIPMTEEDFNKTMDEYYAYRGWDEMGRPKPARLRELGIEEELVSAYEASLA